jgi:hypothetical protein
MRVANLLVRGGSPDPALRVHAEAGRAPEWTHVDFRGWTFGGAADSQSASASHSS